MATVGAGEWLAGAQLRVQHSRSVNHRVPVLFGKSAWARDRFRETRFLLETPEHNLNMAFTRLIAAPMDYHLGGFRAVPQSSFNPRNVAPNVLGTRCHHLALYVCFDNSNPMVADDPAAYEGQPGFDFLKMVPTWWDETRVLAGEMGKLLITAKRSGQEWHVGGTAAGPGREMDLPLAFLGRGRYEAKV